MKTLQLTSIKLIKKKQDYYLSEDALIFPECKIKENKILVPRFLNDEESINVFNNVVDDYYKLILPVLVNYLNYIHKENYKSIYWERIVGFWLLSIITNYLDKYKRLLLAFDKEPNIQTASLSFSNFQIPISTKEFFCAIRESTFFHLQQYSVVLNDLRPNRVKYIEDLSYSLIQDVKKLDRSETSKSIKNFIRKSFFALLNRGYKSKVAFYVSLFSNKELFTFFWKSRFKFAPIFKDTTVEIKREINVELRNKISNFSTNNNLADLILQNSIKYFFPIEILEGYPQISEETSKYIKNNVPISIYTGIGFYWSSQFSVWAAKCADLGTKLYGMQHGGTYGEVSILGWEFLERKITDYYITWGWKENEKTIPLSASKLINLNKKEKYKLNKNENILWVTTADSRYNYFVGQIVFGNRFLKYFEHQINLYGLLNSEIRDKITIRLYKDDFGWKLKERFLDSYPEVKFSNNSENFVNQAAQSKLVIIDHFGGTTFLELITLNIPVIVVGNINLFKHRDQGEPFYEELRKVGVFYSCNKKAAKEIKNILKDVKGWFENKERKIAIEKYKKNYALIKLDAVNQWMNFLKSN